MTETPAAPSAAPRLGWIASLLVGGTRVPWLAEPLLLAVRLYVGWTMMLAGKDKLPTPDWMVDQVEQMGWFPAEPFFASVACLSEFVGGALLCLGLLTRPAAWFVGFTMGVAAFSFQEQTPIFGGIHVAQQLCWLCVVFLALGGGRLSLDAVVRGVLIPRDPSRPKRTRPAAIFTAVLAVPLLGYGLFLELGPAPEPVAAQPAEDVEVTAVSVPGAFNDWDLTALPLELQPDGTWSGTARIEQPGPIEFKFAVNGAWDINLGDNDPGTAGFPVDGNAELGGDNIPAYIPTPGSFRFTLDPDGNHFRLEPAAPAPEEEPTDAQESLISSPDAP